jgi:hypothetical protein
MFSNTAGIPAIKANARSDVITMEESLESILAVGNYSIYIFNNLSSITFFCYFL